LWMASSVVWIVFAGWLFFPEAKKKISYLPDSSMFDKAYKLAIQVRTGDISERNKEVYEEALRRGFIPKVTFVRDLLDEELMSKPLEEQLSNSTIYVAYADVDKEFSAGSEPYTIWEAYKPRIRAKRMKIYLTATGWAFAPPLATLLCGLIIAWVFRGFVAREKNS